MKFVCAVCFSLSSCRKTVLAFTQYNCTSAEVQARIPRQFLKNNILFVWSVSKELIPLAREIKNGTSSLLIKKFWVWFQCISFLHITVSFFVQRVTQDEKTSKNASPFMERDDNMRYHFPSSGSELAASGCMVTTTSFNTHFRQNF